MTPNYITSLHPIRDTVISSDEIVNLIIALNTAKDFREFFHLVNPENTY